MATANKTRRRERQLRAGIGLLGGTLGVLILTGTVARAQQDAMMRPAAEARLPGWAAASGLLRMPVAYVQRNGEVTGFAAGDRGTMGGMLLGLGQRLELGVAVGDTNVATSRTFASAKLNLLPEALLAPAISVGVLDAFDDSPEGRSEYMVMSKNLIPYFLDALAGQRNLSLKLHAGYGSGLYHSQFFAGAELWGANGIGALGEVVAGRLNLGARYYRKGIGVTLGWLEGKRVGGAVSYTVPLH